MADVATILDDRRRDLIHAEDELHPRAHGELRRASLRRSPFIGLGCDSGGDLHVVRRDLRLERLAGALDLEPDPQ